MTRPTSSASLLVLLAACAPAARQAPVTNLQLDAPREPMTTTPTDTAPTRPPIDLRAPAQLRTATFALG